LVEVLIAALLLVLVLFAALGLYERGAFTWSRAEKAADLQDQLRVALNALGTDLREARGIYWPGSRDPLDQPVEIQAGDTAETDLIDLEVPRRDTPTEVETVSYSWAPTGTGDTRNVLRRQDERSGTPQPVAHHITYIRISPEGQGLVEVLLRAAREYRGRTIEAELEGTFCMRAAQ
jgi:hypothetical protein